jgi:hypothetical protein
LGCYFRLTGNPAEACRDGKQKAVRMASRVWEATRKALKLRLLQPFSRAIGPARERPVLGRARGQTSRAATDKHRPTIFYLKKISLTRNFSQTARLATVGIIQNFAPSRCDFLHFWVLASRSDCVQMRSSLPVYNAYHRQERQ